MYSAKGPAKGRPFLPNFEGGPPAMDRCASPPLITIENSRLHTKGSIFYRNSWNNREELELEFDVVNLSLFGEFEFGVSNLNLVW